MKNSLLTLAGCALLTAAIGCSKSEDPAKTPTPAAASDMQKTVDATVKDAQQKAGEVKAAAEKIAADAEKQAKDAAAAVQGVIAQAKTLVAEKKYPEALTLLQQKTAELKLTAEQQKLLDPVKAEIQKLMAGAAASEGAKAVGGLIGK